MCLYRPRALAPALPPDLIALFSEPHMAPSFLLFRSQLDVIFTERTFLAPLSQLCSTTLPWFFFLIGLLLLTWTRKSPSDISEFSYLLQQDSASPTSDLMFSGTAGQSGDAYFYEQCQYFISRAPFWTPASLLPCNVTCVLVHKTTTEGGELRPGALSRQPWAKAPLLRGKISDYSNNCSTAYFRI